MKITPKLEKAAQYFAVAYWNSRAWNRMVQRLIKLHGDKPEGKPHISGIYAEHFPEVNKKLLKTCCNNLNRYSKLAYDARPKGVRYSTMINLKDFIKNRDGSGYYG